MALVKLSGRLVGQTIELDEAVPMLEGKRIEVTILEAETLDSEDDPVTRAFREAPLDEEPLTADEREHIALRSNGAFVTTAEMRLRLAAGRKSPAE